MVGSFINVLKVFNDIVTAGIAIIAFSLLLYALSFNLRDRVARSFAIILLCVVIVSASDAIAGNVLSTREIDFWLRLQWIGIIFLPPAYLHFSDALLETTGRPSRGRRRRLVRLTYLLSAAFLITLISGLLVGPLLPAAQPAPHLERTWLTWVFAFYFLLIVGLALINLWRAHRRSVTSTSRRRMRYLLLGSLAPILDAYPFLLFGSQFAADHPLIFWLAATSSSLVVSFLLILMAYSVAFFGVAWPDRVVKRRLFKWLMRGPITAILVLALTTLVRRVGEAFHLSYPTAIPIVMVGSLLLLEHIITLAAPVWERWLFHGGDPAHLQLVQSLEERMLTSGDLRDFLESVLAALCDRLQVSNAFIVVLGDRNSEMLLTTGSRQPFSEKQPPTQLIEAAAKNGGIDLERINDQPLFQWKDFWIAPLFAGGENERLLGFLGVEHNQSDQYDNDQVEAVLILSRRAAQALEDVHLQQQVFTSLETLTPQVDMIQRLRAAARYDGASMLTAPDLAFEDRDMLRYVKDALTHYWGGPKLSQSPLMRLQVVQRALEEHKGNPTNALRAILSKAIEKVRPEGERRFTGEWLLYNILEMKFLEGRKVREVAMKLAVSEADLYRKQRVAIEAVARAIMSMEQDARKERKTALSQDKS